LVGGNTGYLKAITSCYSSSTVTGEDYVGGLVGVKSALVVGSYSRGAVEGTGDSVGGLVGIDYTDNKADSSFWDIETSGQTKSAGGIGITTSEMQTASTFLDAGWDFIGKTDNGTDDIWWINEGLDYPRLWWERNARFE
jgi:hypothetical protein